jgi:hypothetical protein
METTKKFNEWQLSLIQKGLELVKEQFIFDIAKAESEGKTHLFHPNFVDMTISETLELAQSLTKKTKHEKL